MLHRGTWSLTSSGFRSERRQKATGGTEMCPNQFICMLLERRVSSVVAQGLKLPKNCENESLNPFLGSREGKYQSILFRLARLESSHLQAVMSYSKYLHDVRGRQMASCSESPFSLFDLYFILWVNPNEVRRQRTFLCCWHSSLRYNLSAFKCLTTMFCYKIFNKTLFEDILNVFEVMMRLIWSPVTVTCRKKSDKCLN